MWCGGAPPGLAARLMPWMRLGGVDRGRRSRAARTLASTTAAPSLRVEASVNTRVRTLSAVRVGTARVTSDRARRGCGIPTGSSSERAGVRVGSARSLAQWDKHANMSGKEKIAVFPSRMALTQMKIRLKGAQKGHSLLKKKADALTMRFRALVRKIVENKTLMGEVMKEAAFSLAEANFHSTGFG